MEAIISTQRIKTVYNLLRITFTVVPVVAGIDKFVNLLTQWSHYVNPQLAGLLPVTPETFMMIVGIIEISAGLLVYFRPAFGGYIVAAWLTLIGISILIGGNNLDVAVRDFVMALAALSLARISLLFNDRNNTTIA